MEVEDERSQAMAEDTDQGKFGRGSLFFLNLAVVMPMMANNIMIL